MYSFTNDYSEICHPDILKRLTIENGKQFSGYSEDIISEKVRKRLKEMLRNENADIHFLTGGTQTNLITILKTLDYHQGVIAANSGHIATHESGAIEAGGHKVLTINSDDGKIYPEQVKKVMTDFLDDETYEHVVEPGMLYISNPTEVGTIYSRTELSVLRATCDEYRIPLFIDGARLASALCSKDNDVEFADLAKYSDMFYIGGTKCGAMFGECLVIINDAYKKHFRPLMKQRGALLAKGFTMAIQFDELFREDLYFRIGEYENNLANLFNDSLAENNIPMYQKQVTNQVFPILSNAKISELKHKYEFHVWDKIDDDNSAIRICMSFNTDKSKVEELIKDIVS